MNVNLSEYFALFIIITLGFAVGRLKIKGISLDISAIIFVSLFFGYLGISISDNLQQIGLLFFIYTVGLQAGPGFIQSFKEKGLQLIIFAVFLILTGTIITFLTIKIFHLQKELAIGLFTGALTSTPGLAVAIDATKSSLASLGYGIAYPFGVLGVVLFIRILPRILGINFTQAEREIHQIERTKYPEIINKNFIVENEKVIGKTIELLNLRSMTGANISRILHEGEAITPTSNTVLDKGDLIKAVGSAEALNKVELIIGRSTSQDIPLNKNYEVQSVLVTNKKIVNKTLRQLNLHSNYNATITRVMRSGIVISPTPELHLQFGDKLMIACSRDDMKQVTNILGNDDRRLSDTDLFPLATGIILGVLLGKININFGDKFSFSPGLTGGVLIVALILGNIGKTGPVLWTMSGTANNLLRQLGLIFFLSAVGTKAGVLIVDTFETYGYKLFVIGAILTLLPMLLSTLIAHFVLRMNILVLLGTLAGSMTSTPGLAATDSYSRNNAAQIAYATVYPIAMIFLIICVQILSLL
ncbi:MAG: transporter [Bacteroidales bacterium]|nr:transporter [Bacteroidales bacterium]